MGFSQGKFAKVWKTENKGKYTVAQMSTSKKDKQTDKYETDWQNSFVRLVGTAHTQAQSFKDGESVKIGSCDVTNSYDKEKKITYTNYTIFNFEDTGNNSSKSNGKPQSTPSTPTHEDDDLPF